MRAVTGKPIKLIGTGEKMDALETFDPQRIAGRILGMGDIVSLVERAAETIEKEDAEKLAAKHVALSLEELRKLGVSAATLERTVVVDFGCEGSAFEALAPESYVINGQACQWPKIPVQLK